MGQRKSISSRIREHLWVSGLAFFDLNLFLLAGGMIFRRTCPMAGGLYCAPMLGDLEPLLVALGFWAIGLVVRSGDRSGAATALFLLCAAALASGDISGMGSDAGGRLFYILLAWLAPVTLYFHHIILNRAPGRLGRLILFSFMILALVESMPFFLWPLISLKSRGWFPELRFGIRLALVLAFGLGWLLLFRSYRRDSRLVQKHIRLTVFCMLLAASPLLLLSLLPETFGAPSYLYLPYEWTFPWLLLAPLSYAYSLFRRQLPKAEAAINRLAVYYMAITLFLSLYLIVATLLNYLTINPSDYWPLGSALLGVGLVLIFAPLQRLLQRLMVWILYGGETHYTEVVGRLSETIALAMDRNALHHLLLVEWPRLMRLTGVIAFLKDSDETLTLFGAMSKPSQSLIALRVDLGGRLMAYLQSAPLPLFDRQVRQAFARVSLSADETTLLALPDIAYWLPLVSGGILQGLLLVEWRAEDDPFSVEEERILATLANQAGIAAHNVRLAEELRMAHQDLAQAHQQLLLERDQSQRRMALELHDDGIQQLLGISFQLSAMQKDLSQMFVGTGQEMLREHLTGTLQSVQDEVFSLVAYLRRLTYELHPPGLEEMGLSLALESYVNHLKDQEERPTPVLELEMDEIAPADLTMPLAITLFRTAQEALRNALRHAQAHHVTLSLHRFPEKVVMRVWDDGCGFRSPARLGELARSGHFGLVSMAERVAWAGGELDISSQPGAGTVVTVRIALESEEENSKDGKETAN